MKLFFSFPDPELHFCGEELNCDLSLAHRPHHEHHPWQKGGREQGERCLRKEKVFDSEINVRVLKHFVCRGRTKFSSLFYSIQLSWTVEEIAIKQLKRISVLFIKH